MRKALLVIMYRTNAQSFQVGNVSADAPWPRPYDAISRYLAAFKTEHSAVEAALLSLVWLEPEPARTDLVVLPERAVGGWWARLRTFVTGTKCRT